MGARLKERYEKEVRPKLMDRFSYKSIMQAPRIEKMTLNMGVGEAKTNTALLDAASEQLEVITGQKPTVRRARKSIANFKLREGMAVGVKVTLRRQRMYEMLDRLQSIAIPRIRDFRGLSRRSFDGRGNFSLGIREQIIFPEVDYDSIDQVRGLDVTITTSARSDEEAFELLRLLGMPFRSENGDAAQGAERPAAGQQAPEVAEETPAQAPEPTAETPEPTAEASQEAAPETPADAAPETPADAAPETPADAAPEPQEALAAEAQEAQAAGAAEAPAEETAAEATAGAEAEEPLEAGAGNSSGETESDREGENKET
jgi:large subunit ribosomal protein L5